MDNNELENIIDLRKLMDQVTPALLKISPKVASEILRLGSENQFPKAKTINETNFEKDGLFVALAIKMLPTLLQNYEKQFTSQDETPFSWTLPLEAFNIESREICLVTVSEEFMNDDLDSYTLNDDLDGWKIFKRDGRHASILCPWYIKNSL